MSLIFLHYEYSTLYMQVFFPFQSSDIMIGRIRRLSAHDLQMYQEYISSFVAEQMFGALTIRIDGKTPLHHAIEKNHLW